jgi:hypothetical protein
MMQKSAFNSENRPTSPDEADT